MPVQALRHAHPVQREDTEVSPPSHWQSLHSISITYSVAHKMAYNKSHVRHLSEGDADAHEGSAGQLQRCLADITDALHSAKGRTRLFIPLDPITDFRTAVQDKVGYIPMRPC